MYPHGYIDPVDRKGGIPVREGLCLMTVFDDCFWWLCLLTVFDDCVWSLGLMTVLFWEENLLQRREKDCIFPDSSLFLAAMWHACVVGLRKSRSRRSWNRWKGNYPCKRSGEKDRRESHSKAPNHQESRNEASSQQEEGTEKKEIHQKASQKIIFCQPSRNLYLWSFQHFYVTFTYFHFFCEYVFFSFVSLEMFEMNHVK